MASPIKFTEALQKRDTLKIKPQGGSLMEALGFGLEKVEEKDPDLHIHTLHAIYSKHSALEKILFKSRYSFSACK